MNPETTAVIWPNAPYKGLAYYTSEDVALFGGRQSDVLDCADLLVKDETKTLFLHGRSACGKSSFLRAGLIPYLESQVEIFKFLRNFDITGTRALFIRCTHAPMVRLAETIYDWGEHPLPVEIDVGKFRMVDTVQLRNGATERAIFAREVGNSVPRLMSLLRQIHDLFPKWLILVIDQGEEILTLTHGPDGEKQKGIFFEFINEFNKSSLNLKLVIALRSEYWGDVQAAMKRHNYELNHLEWYNLEELSYQKLVDAVKIPTSRSIPEIYLQGRRQPADEYMFDYAKNLPELIVQDLLDMKNKQGGVLSILQISCGRLHRLAKKRHKRGGVRWEITVEDYNDIGELEQQVDLYLNETIRAKIKEQLPYLTKRGCDEELALWKDLLWELVVTEQDGRALTTIYSEDLLREAAQGLRCRVNFDVMAEYLSQEDQRILREDGRSVPRTPERRPHGTLYYSLGHDTIAVALSRWREKRGLVLDRRGFLRNIFTLGTSTVATLLLAAGVVVLGTAAVKDEVRNPWLAVAAVGALLVGGCLLVRRIKIAAFLAKSFVSATAFHGLFVQTTETQHLIRRMQNSFNSGLPQTPSVQDRALLKGVEEVLRGKPEKEYTPADWIERAFAAYAERKLELSAEYFGQAEVTPGTTALQRAGYMINRGLLFDELRRHHDALAIYDEVFARCSNSTDPSLAVIAARALVNKGVTLGALDRSAEAIAVYDDLLARFSTATELPLREQVAIALRNKGFTLGAIGRSAEAIAVYDDLLARFGTATELPLRELVARTLVNKGVALSALDRSAEEIAVYDDLLARFSTATELPLREQVANALRQQGDHARRARPQRRGDCRLRRSAGPLQHRDRVAAARTGRHGAPQQGDHARRARPQRRGDCRLRRSAGPLRHRDRVAAARTGRQDARQQGGQARRARPQCRGDCRL